ncbi:rpiA [Wigglesworthia glossinidia endosymbiont of Glossina brevipalpis]|uniref:Ribose-5-phosphate isomerase A n=1 Tax=Wigglesworthia glossinidia brevipalpis TaxID=36870 RepID=RPIA_WIGBR|nr:RecName: Full=Ribose-5-phosphate isomerase A; AltName: Full=Phosphoriboisomerase A; Short=PRI [Wigglesworthia glossinidia endosymbiont of Glossina brevipalpis]BAC24648.1 rpiA [Wigglesworthia glossinidia endosymbiont of Glossina brevipalpis]
MIEEKLKKQAAWAAIKYIKPGDIVGVGSGSTAEYFIDALGSIKNLIKGTVSSSRISSSKLKDLNIPLFDLNEVSLLNIYVDGADEINQKKHMIKGKGAALTREKIIASAAKKFICIVDSSKFVHVLGRAPLPIEVIPMARTLVSKKIIDIGGSPKYRKGIITENGNVLLDVHNLIILDSLFLEEKINNIPGVVSVGLFAHRAADIAIISGKNGIKIID